MQTKEQKLKNARSPSWTKEETDRLIEMCRNNKWERPSDAPLTALSQKFPGRTPKAIKSKLARIMVQHELIYWDKELAKKAFHLYLQGNSFQYIKEALQIEATLDQLEAEIMRRRKEAEEFVRNYAKDQGFEAAARLSTETLLLFRTHFNTTSDFTRKALHQRIRNG